jgi:uncharacterized protein YaaW (UPF0174 family)
MRCIMLSSNARTFVRDDHDLYPVLCKATDEELGLLVATMTPKASCDIKGSCRDPELIANELQRFGGESLTNMLRGHGVGYDEIVRDVAKKVGDDLAGCHGIAEKEWRIVAVLIDRAVEKMEPEKREEFWQELKKQGADLRLSSTKLAVLEQAGYQAVRLVLVRVLAGEFLKKLGVNLAGRLVLGRIAALLAGPIGWVVAAIWAIFSLTGPAYSVTVPAVSVVAMMRARQAAEAAAATARRR